MVACDDFAFEKWCSVKDQNGPTEGKDDIEPSQYSVNLFMLSG